MVTINCACGKVHCFEVGHYSRILVKCGRPYWALRPIRSGPLVMFPWPGQNLSRQQMAEQAKGETGL